MVGNQVVGDDEDNGDEKRDDKDDVGEDDDKDDDIDGDNDNDKNDDDNDDDDDNDSDNDDDRHCRISECPARRCGKDVRTRIERAATCRGRERRRGGLLRVSAEEHETLQAAQR
jgi:ABC-type Zn2+ transport system substrate-binding protein/surface adhesin